MHGAVNQAVEDLIISKWGIATWKKVKSKSGFIDEMFLSNEPYPDKLTYDLVIATNEITDLPVNDILFALGEHWILETGKNKYGSLLKSGGSDFKEFIKYLPKFHGRIMLLYPNIIPPEFEVMEIENNTFEIKYFSDRPNLTQFVAGLLNGISKMFNTNTDIEIVSTKDENQNFDLFQVKL